ncbi:MAG: hypothetical protein JXR61_14240 [Prolixibacteraceae bacterium]|nr:hypothetical protein [Prolixibacteraceae bacterium]
MKILFTALITLYLFTTSNAFAQSEKFYDYDIEVYFVKSIKDADGNIVKRDTVYTISSGIEQVVTTPVGNYLRMVTFKISQDNPIMELAQPVAFFRITATGDFDGDGVEETLVDKFSALTKSGNLKLVYHHKNK